MFLIGRHTNEGKFMGLRFRKSFKVAPGVKVNLNKKSTSVTFGGKGVHKTYSSSGKKTTSVGIPGTDTTLLLPVVDLVVKNRPVIKGFLQTT